jgi:hypothetical protein
VGTKNNPSTFDCYAKLDPDEPHFVLMARDASAPGLVRRWAQRRQEDINTGRKPLEDQRQVDEALQCADTMDAWRFSKKLPFGPEGA